jgi:hypothetical protein
MNHGGAPVPNAIKMPISASGSGLPPCASAPPALEVAPAIRRGGAMQSDQSTGAEAMIRVPHWHVRDVVADPHEPDAAPTAASAHDAPPVCGRVA